MLKRRIIPCLDIKNGRVVKGVHFGGLRDAGDPVEAARAYDAQGADELCLLDITATTEGRETFLEVVRRVAPQLFVPLTVGGGVRRAEDVRRLLNAGADKVSIMTAAIKNPELVEQAAAKIGSANLVVAIDAKQVSAPGESPRWEVFTHGGRQSTGIDAVEWAARMAAAGAGEILLTSWDRDGTRAGYDLALIAAVTRAVSVPVIASGGADQPEHLVEAIHAGADAVLAASIFHQGDYTVAALKEALHRRGVLVRRDAGTATQKGPLP